MEGCKSEFKETLDQINEKQEIVANMFALHKDAVEKTNALIQVGLAELQKKAASANPPTAVPPNSALPAKPAEGDPTS